MQNNVFMSTLVSIIVPAYNAESYISSCVNGVLGQSFQNWELVIIDDGSTDNTLSICNEFAKKDSRIKVIPKQNTGVSDTRNRGILEAIGKYLMFLDADDLWCHSCFLEQFVQVAEDNKLDILRGEYKAIDANGEELYIKVIDNRKSTFKKKILDSVSFLENILQREFFLPLCLIRRDIIQDIQFNPCRAFLEDVEFFIQVLLRPLRCYYIPIYFYAYRKHVLSASNKFNVKRLADAFDISRLYLNLSLNVDDEKLAKSFKVRSWDYYWLTLRTMATEKSLFVNGKSLCHELSLIELKDRLSDIMSDINPSNKWLVKFSPYVVIWYFRLRYVIGKFLK